MSEESLDLDATEDPTFARAVQRAPRYLGMATATLLWWMYLVMGEFVLSGLPEWLGWLTGLAIAGANHWAMERQFAPYLPTSRSRQRLTALLIIGLMCASGLLLALLLGSLLPEPAVTVLLFAVIGIVAWRKRSIRRRWYVALPRDPHWRSLGRIAFIGALTIFAMGALIARS